MTNTAEVIGGLIVIGITLLVVVKVVLFLL